MKVVVQRVSEASLTVDGEPAGSIGAGLVVLAGFRDADTEAELDWTARKVVGLRVFPDGEGNLNRCLEEVAGGLVVVPNFTLYGDCRKGRRPSFTKAGSPAASAPLYERFAEMLEESGLPVVRGIFGAHMHVALTNDGPTTLVIEREADG